MQLPVQWAITRQRPASNLGYNGKQTSKLPSFQRFFYQNGQNSTFNQFLCKILTNKSTRKKFQLIEGTKQIDSNNFHHNWRSLRCLNKLKTVTQAVSTIMGKCFWGCWQPIRCQLLRTLDQLTNQKLPIIVDKLFLSQKMP